MAPSSGRRVGQIGELPVLPEARVWRPTEEQFKDFYGYIRHIQPEAHLDGISLIVPPASWKPPFSIELPKFRFGTRVQKINELFERNVVRVRFLTCLREFHDANGTPLTHIPALGGSEIDLFRLYNAVRSRGGYDKVCAERKWPAVARALHYEGLAHAAQALRACHQKLLLGYENLPDEARRGMLAEKAQRISERLQQEGIPTGSLMSSRAHMNAGPAGRKAGSMAEPVERSNAALDDKEVVIAYEPPIAGAEVCEVCKSGGDAAKMILCDRCNCGFHCFCLTPPLSAVPAGDWLCVDCMGERFGFGSGGRYTFDRYTRLAHAFKRSFFETQLGKRKRGEALTDVPVPVEDVEWQFWNAVACPARPLEALYGSDLDSLEVGSGFPKPPPLPSAEPPHGAATATGGAGRGAYASHAWNVNNIGSRSLLSALGVGISGMVVPWLYVGMLFSAFCWHIEDHCCHSVNYMHFGADKTWYGVPATDSRKFESAMRAAAPDLFEHESGLLHRMVTMVPPAELLERGVRVRHVLQRAGTFVITWPAAYHCGFSHGLNCAESTNFAAEDWLPWGSRAARESRASPGARALCFNHEHLLCALAQRAIDAARARANVCTPRGVRGGLCAPLAGASLCVYFLGWLQPEVRAMVDGEIAARTALIGRCAGIERTRPIAMRQLPAQLPEHGGKNGAKAATKLHSPNVPSGMPGSSPARASDETPSAAAGCDRAAQCGVCGYELRISWVRCAGCGRCMCLEHLGAEQPRVRDCACAVTAEPPCEADGAAGGDGTRASPGLQLVEAWTVEQLCALRAQLDEVALPYLEWRASVRALRGAALGPLDAEVGAAEARAVCGDGDDEGAEEKAVRAGAEGADDGARGSVVSMAELDRLCAVADELGLDPDDVSASVVHALRTRATMWARAAAAVTRTAVGGAAARMPSGERARDDTPRRLIAEHDDELPVAFAELRASLVALECDVASWTAEAQRLLQLSDMDASAVPTAELRACAERSACFALALDERRALGARARSLDWMAECPEAVEATLPLAKLRAIVEQGKRLGIQPSDCRPFATLSERAAAGGHWLASAQSALRSGAHARTLRALLAAARTVSAALPAKELDALRARLDATEAWASETRDLLARVSPRASNAELARARDAAIRLKLRADATAEACAGIDASSADEGTLMRALGTRLAGAAAWRKAAHALLAKRSCRRTLAAILTDDMSRASADERKSACAHCVGEGADALAPAAVSWLACDACGGWVHAHCVHLTPEAADALNAYTCARCCARAALDAREPGMRDAPIMCYALGAPPPLVLTARPPTGAARGLLASARDLDSMPDETAMIGRWLEDADGWAERAAAAVGAAALPDGVWRAPTPPPPFAPRAIAHEAGVAQAGAATTRTPSRRAISPCSRARAAGVRSLGADPPPSPADGGVIIAAADGGPGSARARGEPTGQAAARLCAAAVESASCAHLLGSLLHSARGLQLSPPFEEVAIALELCVRAVEVSACMHATGSMRDGALP